MGCPEKYGQAHQSAIGIQSQQAAHRVGVTEPSVMACKPTGRPPVFPSVLTTPDASSLIMRPSSRPVTQLPSTAHDTSSGPSPRTSINATSDSSEFTAKPSTKPGLAGRIQTRGSIGDLTNATASTAKCPANLHLESSSAPSREDLERSHYIHLVRVSRQSASVH